MTYKTETILHYSPLELPTEIAKSSFDLNLKQLRIIFCMPVEVANSD